MAARRAVAENVIFLATAACTNPSTGYGEASTDIAIFSETKRPRAAGLHH